MSNPVLIDQTELEEFLKVKNLFSSILFCYDIYFFIHECDTYRFSSQLLVIYYLLNHEKVRFLQ